MQPSTIAIAKVLVENSGTPVGLVTTSDKLLE